MVRTSAATSRVDEPAVKSFSGMQSAKTPQAGFMKRLWNNLFGQVESKSASNTPSEPARQVASNANRSKQQSVSKNQERRSPNPNQANRRRRPSGNTTNNTTNPTGSPQAQARQPGNTNPNSNTQRNKRPAGSQQHSNRTAPVKTVTESVNVKKKEQGNIREQAEE